MLELYIVRHGETHWNIEKRMQGRLDSSLSPLGREQAQRLGVRLNETKFDAVYLSPSGRAKETTSRIDPKTEAFYEDERLMEIDLGEWQGLTETDIKDRDPLQFFHYYHRPERFINDCGENFFDVRRRVEMWLKEVESCYPSGKILVVTHGVVTKTFLQIANNEPIQDFWRSEMVHGASLTILTSSDGQRTITTHNCIDHLASVTNVMEVK